MTLIPMVQNSKMTCRQRKVISVPDKPISLCLFGAGPDTGNLGVSALCYSVLSTLAGIDPAIHVTVFDEGRGARRETASFGVGSFSFERCGATQTRRYYRRECYWNIRVCNWLGGLGNPAAERLRACNAVLDVSGGDSFTDLYGSRRFTSVMMTKRLALDLNKPLILLPQTYGPFRDPKKRIMASEVIRCSAQAWARDPRSFEILKDLAGSEFDPQRHRCGVDIAFGLKPREPMIPLSNPISTWLSDGFDGRVIGFNVSGLIWNDSEAAVRRYGFKADYRECVLGFLRYLLQETDVKILLVPHVLTPLGDYESDPGANLQVQAALENEPGVRERLATLFPIYDQSETKWIISRLDWFCGTRMHACIAGLSSGVPTAAIAYSHKTRGVFETCNCSEWVADPRTLQTGDMIELLQAAWIKTNTPKNVFSQARHGLKVPINLIKVQQQMYRILEAAGMTARNFQEAI